jgi:hypothetical protein
MVPPPAPALRAEAADRQGPLGRPSRRAWGAPVIEMPDPLRHLVDAEDGLPRDVRVPARIAVFLDAVLKSTRIEWRGRDRELDEVLHAINYAAVGFSTYAQSKNRLTPPRTAGESDRPVAGWLDSTAVAGILGCGSANVRDLARRGRLRGGRRIGNRLSWPREAVDEYLAKRETN